MMPDDELLALAQIGVGIAANEVAALIERHRAEVERLNQECFRLAANQCQEGYGDEYGNHRCRAVDKLRTAVAEVERLTRERDGAKEGQDGAREWADSQRRHADAMQDRAEAAESALAAAQKRIAELEAIVEAADRVMIECGFMEGEGWGGHPQDGISIASDLYIEKRGAPCHARPSEG